MATANAEAGRASTAVEAGYQLFLGVVLDIEREALLRELNFVQDVHQENAQRQRHQRGVERNTETIRDRRRVTFDGQLRALQSEADTADGADEPERRRDPDTEPQDGELGVEAVVLALARVVHRL